MFREDGAALAAASGERVASAAWTGNGLEILLQIGVQFLKLSDGEGDEKRGAGPGRRPPAFPWFSANFQEIH